MINQLAHKRAVRYPKHNYVLIHGVLFSLLLFPCPHSVSGSTIYLMLLQSIVIFVTETRTSLNVLNCCTNFKTCDEKVVFLLYLFVVVNHAQPLSLLF